MASNYMTSVNPRVLKGLRILTQLNLHDNKLRTFDANVVACAPSLINLDITGNP